METVATITRTGPAVPRRALLVLASLALLAAACSGDDEETGPLATSSAAVTVTATATATATAAGMSSATPAATMSPAATSTAAPREVTGLPGVDSIIAAVLSGDLERVASLVQLRQVACGPQAGIGSPPPCPAGQPTGTPVPVFPVATCEGEWRSEAVLRPTIQPLLSSPELYAVYGMPSQWQGLMPDGQYAAVFSRVAPGQGGRVGAGVVIAGTRIVGIWYGCGASVDQIVPAGTSTILSPGR